MKQSNKNTVHEPTPDYPCSISEEEKRIAISVNKSDDIKHITISEPLKGNDRITCINGKYVVLRHRPRIIKYLKGETNNEEA